MIEKNDDGLIPITMKKIKEWFPELKIDSDLEKEIEKKDIFLSLDDCEVSFNNSGFTMESTGKKLELEELLQKGLRYKDDTGKEFRCEIYIYDEYTHLKIFRLNMLEEYEYFRVIQPIIREIDEEELAPIMKYFPEWKTRLRDEFNIKGRQRMEFYIIGCNYSREEAAEILEKFKNRMKELRDDFPVTPEKIYWTENND